MQITGTTGTLQNRLLLVIILLAAALRLSGLTAFSLSNDELSALARLRFDSLAELIEHGVKPDFHPAGVQFFLWVWTALFGISEWIVRLPFALLGIGSVYLLFRIGKLWFGPATGILAAAGLATLSYPLLYSQIARPYSPGLFFSLLATFCWTNALFPDLEKEKTRIEKLLSFTGFALSVSACMYIHYFSFIFAGLLCFSGLFFLKRETWLPYFAAGAGIVLLYLPHIDVFLQQISKGGVGGSEGWLGPPGKDAFGIYINYCFNDSEKLKLIYFIAFTGTFLVYRKLINFNRFHLVALLFFIIPFLIAYFYSIWKNPVFQHSVLLFSFPFLLLLLFSCIPRGAFGKTVLFLFFVVVTGSVYSTIKEKQYYQSAHFSEFRGIAKKMAGLNKSFGPQNITRVINVFDPYYMEYYLRQHGDTFTLAMSSIIKDEEIRDFSRLLAESTTPYFMFAHSNTYLDPAIDILIRNFYPVVVSRDSFLNSGLKFYTRTQTDNATLYLPDNIYQNGFEKNQWTDEDVFRDTTVYKFGGASIHLKSSQEYSPGLSLTARDAGFVPGAQIELTTWFMTKSAIPGAKLVLSIDRDDKNIFWMGAVASKYVYAQSVWCPVVLSAEIPGGVLPSDLVRIYCWNEKRQEFYIDDFRMAIYLPR